MVKKKIFQAGYILLVAVSILSVFFPFYWLVTISLQDSGAIFSTDFQFYPTISPRDMLMEVFVNSNFLVWIRNSLAVSCGTVPVCVLLASMAAYGISRYEFRGKTFAQFAILIAQMIPTVFLLVPVNVFVARIGLNDSLWGLMLVDTSFVLPVSMWFLKGFCDGIPQEMEEAAVIDGCSRWGIYWRIVLPLLSPSLAAAATWALISVWNEYLFSYTLLQSPGKHTLSIGLAMQMNEYGVNYTRLFGGAVCGVLPVIILFLFFQKSMVSGLTAGAVKE